MRRKSFSSFFVVIPLERISSPACLDRLGFGFLRPPNQSIVSSQTKTSGDEDDDKDEDRNPAGALNAYLLQTSSAFPGGELQDFLP